MAYIIHQESGRQIQLSDAKLTFDPEWISRLGRRLDKVVPNHAELRLKNDGYYIRPLGGVVWVGSRKVIDDLRLTHNSAFILGDRYGGGAIFVYKDVEQQQKMLDSQKVKLASIERDRIKSAAEKLAIPFFGNVPTTLREFGYYILRFLVKEFQVDRGVLFRIELTIDGKSGVWKPVAAVGTKPFTPPKKILDHVWKSKEPFRFCVEDFEETSLSIQRDSVSSAICFPMFRDDKLIGVLYVDKIATDGDCQILGQEDLLVLCTLMPAFSSIFYILLTQDQYKINADKLINSFCKASTPVDIRCVCVNKQLHTFGVAKQNSKATFFVFIQVVNKNSAVHDFTQIAVMLGGIIALIDAIPVGSLIEEIYPHISEFMRGRFSDHQLNFGIVKLVDDRLYFSGVGSISIVVKPPDRNSFLYAIERQCCEKQFDCDIIPGTRFVLSGFVPEKVCGHLDRMRKFDRVVEELRKATAGCIIVEVLRTFEKDQV